LLELLISPPLNGTIAADSVARPALYPNKLLDLKCGML
jgi:hypothetical protein